MSRIRVLIIDDEHLARELIQSYLDQEEDIELIGECSDGFEGFKIINELKPDLVFLDVKMPKLNGFEMLELLEDPPIIVFSTAYDEYAIKAFEQNAVDYLLKPYSKNRFNEAIGKVKAKLSSDHGSKPDLKKVIRANWEGSDTLTRVAVRTGTKIQIVPVEKIRYLEAMDDYVKLHTEAGDFLKQNTMKYYEDQLPSDDFLRIHRSYMVRLKEIARLELLGKDSYIVFLHDGSQLSVSRSGYKRLKDVLDF